MKNISSAGEVPSSVEAGSQSASSKAAMVGGLKILLVEDDDADAYLIERALNANARVGEVVRACDGVEALEIVDQRQFKPDLAIVDLRMPRKDGFALLTELGGRVTAEFPAVVFTSARSGADAVRSRHRGAVRFITKPHRAEQMAETLNDVLAGVNP